MMRCRIFLVLFAFVAPINAAQVGLASGLKVQARARREAAIRQGMKSMSMEEAFNVLEHKQGLPKAFSSLVQKQLHEHGHAVGKQHLTGKARFLGSHLSAQDPEGYGGSVGAADTMLGQMISESEMNLDTEEERCELFHTQSTAGMGLTRSDISTANAQSAAARAELMRSGAEIEVLQEKIPKTKRELQDHNQECYNDVTAINSQIELVKQDLGVLYTVVNMSVCSDANVDAAGLLETSSEVTQLMCCQNPGSNEVSVYMRPNGPLSKLQSSTAKLLQGKSFPKAHRAQRHIQGNHVSFAQLASMRENRAGFPLLGGPTTPVISGEVCPEEAAEKCTIADSPSCPRIRSKFVELASGVRDKLDDLKLELANTQTECHNTKINLEAQIDGMAGNLVQEQAASAAATQQMNQADEQSRLKQLALVRQRLAYRNELRTCTVYEGGIECKAEDHAGVCSENINAYMTEICGLKKIRTELSKVEGDNITMISDMVDCEVSRWRAEPCPVTCGGGTRIKRRYVTVPPSHGASCPPLEIEEACNIDPCPIDCVHEDWSEWSSCSASCGGGAKERERGIEVYAFFGGEACGDTTEAQDCHVESCDQNCELNQWSEWCGCDKMCGGGEQKRVRTVKKAASGQGTCWDEEDDMRIEYQQCNMQECLDGENRDRVLKCEANVDIILVLDGSEEVGETGFADVKTFAEMFVNSLDMSSGKVQVAILLFGGPDRQPYINRCRGDELEASDEDISEYCRVKWVEHFTGDSAKALESVKNMEWPRGTRMTHLALEFAESELSNGREDTPSVVYVLSAGRPSAERLAFEAAEDLREKTRLMFSLEGPGAIARLLDFERMVERPGLIEQVPELSAIGRRAYVNRVVADVCPELDVE